MLCLKISTMQFLPVGFLLPDFKPEVDWMCLSVCALSVSNCAFELLVKKTSTPDSTNRRRSFTDFTSAMAGVRKGREVWCSMFFTACWTHLPCKQQESSPSFRCEDYVLLMTLCVVSSRFILDLGLLCRPLRLMGTLFLRHFHRKCLKCILTFLESQRLGDQTSNETTPTSHRACEKQKEPN